MGTMISKNRSADAIFVDFKEAVTNSAALGGKAAEIAAEALTPVEAMIDEVDADLLSARKTALPLLAAVDVARAKASEAVHITHDLAWNHVGRAKFDAKFALLFPNGARHYIEGAADELPNRMELLAQLFEKGMHPKLTKEQNKASAETLRAAAKAHREAIEAAREPATKVDLLTRTRMSMGRFAHGALTNFKRLLKIAGFTEAQIHAIIPSHPVASAAKKAAAKKAVVKTPAAETRADESAQPVEASAG
jgi:hypothetical protein